MLLLNAGLYFNWTQILLFSNARHTSINSLPNDKILAWFKLKAFVENNIYVTEKLKFALGWVENIMGKGENAGFQHFLLFLLCFQKAFPAGL